MRTLAGDRRPDNLTRMFRDRGQSQGLSGTATELVAASGCAALDTASSRPFSDGAPEGIPLRSGETAAPV